MLIGKENPSGKLPVSVAYGAGQLPIYYSHPFGSSYHANDYFGEFAYTDCPRTPRYPFGYGLSYTKFEYSDLSVSKREIVAGEAFSLSVTVRNTGAYDGTEIVQLYFTDTCASVARPNRSLCGFARVSLPKGGKKRLTFIVNCNQFAFLDEKMRLKVERGDIKLRVAASSADEGLCETVSILKDAYLSETDRVFWAESL